MGLLVRFVTKLGRYWPVVLGWLAAVTWGLETFLPTQARRRRASGLGDFFRELGRRQLAFSALDLLGQALQYPLRIAYPPLPAAWFAILVPRTAISAAAVLACLPLFRLRPAWVRAGALAAHLAFSAGSLYACYVGANVLRTRRVRVRVPGWRGRLRIVHLSDIHIERLTHRDTAMLARVRAAQPDLILLSGDYVNIDWRDAESYRVLHEVLCALGAVPTRYGVFAVRGNADRMLPTQTAFADTGIHLLEDAVVEIRTAGGPVDIVGVACDPHYRWYEDLPAMQTTLAWAGPKAPGTLRILLYHTPDLVPQAAEAGVDLYLCGHTHGGQIRLPGLGAVFTSSRFGRRYDRGLHPMSHGGFIYTTTGVGLEGMGLPRARWACPPEVAVLEVTGDGG